MTFLKEWISSIFVDKCIKKYFCKLFILKRIVHTVHKKQVRLVLPFLGTLSFEIRSRLQKCFKNYIPYCSLRVVYQSRNRISNLFNFKNVVNTTVSSHIMYKFMCSCCNTTFHGQTQDIFLWELLRILVLPRNLLFLIICYWMVIKLVLTIFRYFKQKAIHLNYSWRNLC